jgi:hypothetical protein
MRLLTPRFLACAALAACDFNGDGVDIVPEFDDAFSFETGMEEWYARGIDLGDPPITWEVARTTERADTGTYSVRLTLDNLNDQGKIWIERRYEVAPDQEYEVSLTLALASTDYGTINLWRVLAGATPEQPVDASQLMSSKDTGNGSATDVGFQWTEKTVTMRTRSDEDGEIFVYAGIWGTSEFLRSYALDDVRVTFLRKGLSAPTGPT